MKPAQFEELKIAKINSYSNRFEQEISGFSNVRLFSTLMTLGMY